MNEKNLSSFALLGLGSASSTDLAMDEQNSIGILDFNELGKVKIKIMTISNLDNQNKNITFECTLPVTSNQNTCTDSMGLNWKAGIKQQQNYL